MTPSPFPDPKSRATRELAPGVKARTFWIERMMIALVEIAPEAIVPLHSHPHEQVGVVLEGELAITIGGEERTLQPGETYMIPGAVEHGARSTSEAVRVMDVFSPIRQEYR